MSIKKTYEVHGMHCEKCVARVKKAIESVDGVIACRVRLDKNDAIVKMNYDIDDATIIAAIEAEDFKATPLK